MFELIAANTVLRAAALLALFIAVAAAAYFAATSMVARQATRQRLADASSPGDSAVIAGGSLRARDIEGTWLKLVNAIEKAGLSLVDTRDEDLRRRLAAAGYTAPVAPRVYTLIRLVSVVGLPLLMLFVLWAGGKTPSIFQLYLILGLAAFMGLYAPSLFIRARADRRQREIVNAFPDALDLMLVCVEAGLGLEAAFNRVGMEITTSHPLLAQQFGAVVLEFRAGRNREDALRRMADRAGVDEIRAFSTLLIQSTKLGSSLSQTLRIYAAEMREKRRLRAEERAHRLPVLLSIPLVACMLPVMIGVLMLPAVIRVMRIVMPRLAGG
ncbi:MAG TPA: type II secretion system F family protein [Sphingomicrobium sp.]